jgi:hypothetical protein
MRALVRQGKSSCTICEDRAGVDCAAEMIRDAAADAPGGEQSVDLFVVHADVASFVAEQEYGDWLARAHADDSGIAVMVATDVAAATLESPARTRVLVQFDFPRDATTYRARMARAFERNDDECDDSDGDGDPRERLVVSLVGGLDDADFFRSVSATLRLPGGIAELPFDAFPADD